MNIDLDNHGGDVVDFTKKDHMAAMVGDQPSGEITVLVPKICKNKGNYFKRLISAREKAVMQSKKRIRKCKKCGSLTHDSRTCTKKNEDAVEVPGAKNVLEKRKKKQLLKKKEDAVEAAPSKDIA